MNIKAIFLRYRFQVALVLIWLLAFILIWPIGEFPINDDWAYAKNVHNLMVNGRFVVDDWPAMNLISQTIYGSAITGIFGFSFTVLRISIFFLSVFSSIYLFNIVNRLSGKNSFVAFSLTCFFSFHAMYMHLSMTYMTDVFFSSMLIFALHALLNYRLDGKRSSYFWFTFWCVMAILCRQQALVFALLIIPGVFQQKTAFWKKVFLSIFPLFLCWLASDKYRHHLTANHVGHNLQQVHHLIDYLKIAPLEKHMLQSSDLLLVIGGLLFPVALFLVFIYWRGFQRKDFVLLLLTSVSSFFLTKSAIGIYPTGNISEMFEIGPRLIKGGGEVMIGESARFWHLVNYLLASVSLGLIFFFILIRRRSITLLHQNLLDRTIYLFVILIYFLFVSVSNAYFDRYAIPLFLVLLLFLVPVKVNNTIGLKIVFAGFFIVLFSFSVVENLDYFNWQKKRFEAIHYLHEKGVSDFEIDGGFEFNGWVKKNSAYPTDAKKSWWWVVDDKFIVCAKPISEMQQDTLFVFQRYLPFEMDTIYVYSRP